jgi:hypothetical protein
MDCTKRLSARCQVGVWIPIDRERKVRVLLGRARRSRTLRQRSRISQRRIARIVGVSRGTVSSIATGKIGWAARGFHARRRPRTTWSEPEIVFTSEARAYRCDGGHMTTVRPCPICMAQQAKEANRQGR